MTFVLRRAEVTDAPAISALIIGLAHYSTLDPSGAGAERFFATMTPEALAGCVADPGYDYLVACEGDEIVGVGAVRRPRHLFHLFVREAWHGQGLARRLWQELLGRIAERGAGTVTVFSSLHAVPVYEHFGFAATGPKREQDGIAFVPMERPLELPSGS